MYAVYPPKKQTNEQTGYGSIAAYPDINVGFQASFSEDDTDPGTLYDTVNEIRGHFVYPVYYNDTNGYCVYQYLLADGSVVRKATVRGYYLPKNKKADYVFYGRFTKDKRYGLQFNAENYEEYVDRSKEGLVSYLSSGVIKGIGEKTAQRIYEMFGEKSLEVLEQDPDRYLSIKGVTKKRLETIKESYADGRGAQTVTRFLMQYGVSSRIAARAFRAGFTSVPQLKENPYHLCRVSGFTFYMADTMARRLGIPEDDENRIGACARFILIVNEKNTGSICMEKDDFGAAFLQELNTPSISRQDICNMTVNLIQEKKLVYRRVTYYDGSQRSLLFLPERYNMEKETAALLYRVQQGWVGRKYHDVEDFLDKVESKKGFHLDPLQRDAIITAVNNPVSVITGGPGMGKTTIQGLIAEYLTDKEPDRDILCIAPTGMAARKLTEATGIRASTIHSLLRLRASGSDELLEEQDFEVIEDATIIMDEASMTDIYILYTLLRALGINCRLIIVGDTGQLPSVGPGAILRDIERSGLIPVVQLQNIFRQEKGGMIYENTQNIRRGIQQIGTSNDFMLYPIEDLEEIQEKMSLMYQKRITEYGPDNVMLLCPYKKNAAGVHEMNRILQNACNPPTDWKGELQYKGFTFRTGDRVMNTKNSSDVANGDIGIIEDIFVSAGEKNVRVKFFDSLLVDYTGEELDNLSLAYATTVHKAQGSQADCMITCFTSAHRAFLFRNFPLTAISRGKTHVDYFGPLSVLEKAIETEMTDNRLSLLWYHLSLYSGRFVVP